MKVIILGSGGCLGRQMVQTFEAAGHECVKPFASDTHPLTEEALDVDAIINCAAMTGIKRCAENENRAYYVNGLIPCALALFSQQHNIPVIHFSTEDAINPTAVYGKSKQVGEHPLLTTYRLPLIYGPTHDKQIVGRLVNDLMTGKEVRVAGDVVSTPVYSPDVAKHVLGALEGGLFERGIFHLTGPTYSLAGLILAIAAHFGVTRKVKIATSADFGTEPKNGGLDGIAITTSVNDYVEYLRARP